ncbi:glutamate--tRNA ligase [Candidatus Saccharibacteria bacterium RIFCSPHIGHO2_12_FULL_47_16b]|nr:MAG: glutamate--tRNA ligase [Candidatus Saccharibacteria bacterium RIFCSPHIGHO2_12_FULL_47_16b]OGL38663.1 MAG: glutamate--tRNA ligase [Candidatus Saccharibacteria bacterium RIFCSPLOWO2_02_FULL_46_7]
MVRTRFAPSPTGFMHVGGVRTALFAWLVAKQAKGQFLLRIEDTDRTRHVEESEQHIIDSLRALGLDYNEGPDIGGSYGPYRQSERLDIYRQWAQKLIDKDRAYADPTAEDQLEHLRAEAKAAKKPFLYRNYRPTNPPKWSGRMALRFKSEPKNYQWQDVVLGELQTGQEAIDDFIIIKSDGFPTYNFAHIVDDHLMKISHVIRSQEFLPSIPKFLNLYEALEIERPELATLPYVMGPEGKKKLSKRDGAKDVLEYVQEGYLPEALINFMASLGWNDGTEQEIFSVDELVKKFDLARVQRAGARFDEQRLMWMNGRYIRSLSLDKLYRRSADFWPAKAEQANESYKKKVLGLVQERLKFLAELTTLSIFFFEAPSADAVKNFYKNPVDKQLVKAPPDYGKFLSALVDELKASDFSYSDIQARLNDLLKKLDTKPAVLFPVVRIAISGSSVSPEIFGTLEVLGREETLKRLDIAITILNQGA